MNLINDFFSEMESLFLETDKASFYELKEDLSEHIEIQLSEGKTQQEILDSLGTPQEIVNEFYEDQRLHTALTAEKDVVPIEQVTKVYKNERKEKRKTYFTILKTLLKNSIQLVLLAFAAYFGLSFIREGIIEHYFALSPFILILFFSAAFLLTRQFFQKQQRSKTKLTASIILGLSLIGMIYLSFSNSWFYIGKFHKNELTLDPNQVLNLTINAEYPIEVMTIPIAEDDQARIEIQGYMQQSVSDRLNQLKANSAKLKIDMGKSTFLNLFSKPKANEIILYLPQNEKLENFNLNVAKSNLQLSNISAKEIALNTSEGDIQISNLQAKKMKVTTEKSDLFMTNYATSLSIQNDTGKTILKNGQGKASIHSSTGLVNIQNANSKKFTITNASGKSILNDTLIQDLDISSQDGTLVLENQSGHSTVKNEAGKLILNNNSGFIQIDNTSGTLIISQDKEIAGDITSKSGIVKWVQLDVIPLNFQLKSKTGKIVNEFPPQSNSQAPNLAITTDSGEIRVIKKIQQTSNHDPEATKF